MSATATESLIVDLLEWLGVRERSYEEVMDAWRTSCPRLPVWEEANERGLVTFEEVRGRRMVKPTAAGLILLSQTRQRTIEAAGPS
jgi:D-3-phosphoglycerate dehydrogenase / 2-oxoglutarate reductase